MVLIHGEQLAGKTTWISKYSKHFYRHNVLARSFIVWTKSFLLRYWFLKSYIYPLILLTYKYKAIVRLIHARRWKNILAVLQIIFGVELTRMHVVWEAFVMKIKSCELLLLKRPIGINLPHSLFNITFFFASIVLSCQQIKALPHHQWHYDNHASTNFNKLSMKFPRS